MESTKPFDAKNENVNNAFLETLSKRLKGRTSLMVEMGKIFLDQAPVMKSIIENSHKEGDYESIRFEAHKFKSTVNIIGLDKLRELAAKTEQLYYDGKPKVCTKDLLHDFATQIETDCQKVKSSLEQLTKSKLN